MTMTGISIPVFVLLKDIEEGKLELRLPLEHVEDNPALKEDIRENGVKVPVEIRIRQDMSRILWDGLHRLKIAKELELDSIPVFFEMMEGW